MEIHFTRPSARFEKTIHLLPLVLVLLWLVIQVSYSIIASGGFPYFFDNNESYLSYNHAANLYYHVPSKFSFLTAQDTSFLSLSTKDGIPTPSMIYLHNPNLPRYVNYLLFHLHVWDFIAQYLIITVGAMLCCAYLYKKNTKLLGSLSFMPIVLLFLLESQEIFPYFFNSYRVWSFITFGYCLYAILSKKYWHLSMSFFVLFQFEYAFALFAFSSMFIFNYFINRRDLKKTNLYICIGVALSLLLFGIQLATYMRLGDLYSQFLDVYQRRIGITHESMTRFDVLKIIPQTYQERFGSVIYCVLVYGAIRSVRSIICRDESYKLASLYISIIMAIAITSLCLPGYVFDAYVGYRFPFLCFLLFPGILIIYQDIVSIADALKVPAYYRNLLAIVFPLILYSTFLIPAGLANAKHQPPINSYYLRFMKTEGYKGFFLVDGQFASLPNGFTMFDSSTVDMATQDVNLLVETVKQRYGAQQKIFYMCGPFYRYTQACAQSKARLPKIAKIVYQNPLYFIARLN